MEDCKFDGFGYIFKDLKMQLIGSLKEGTKILITDELDIHLSLNSSNFEDVKFSPKNQMIMVNGNELPSKDYAAFFFQCIRDILSTIQIPPNFSMLPPKTSYSPCLYCMDTTAEEVQPKRCHHESDCKIHSSKSCTEDCNCENFTNPSICWSGFSFW